MITVGTVVQFLEQLAPLHLAAEWDNVGLLLGDRSAAVNRMMTCLTVTPETAEEAIAARADLIVSHHPIFFRPVQRLTDDSTEGRMVLSLIRAGVAVHSPHSAFDNAQEGINDLLAREIDLTGVVPLRPQMGPGQCKVVVFVPESDLARVSEALFETGAGQIGQYSQCSFRLPGTGTFFGSGASNPTVGKKGRREEVGEWRLEVICPEAAVARAIGAMRKAHSYEEPAFDVYPLRSLSGAMGEGRLGQLSTPVTLQQLAHHVKSVLNARQVQLVGSPQRQVARVAIACGAGGDFLPDAVRSRADVLLTGEMRYHDYLAAQAQGVALLLPGHYATERPGVESLAVRLQLQWPHLRVWASKKELDPISDVIG